MPIDDLEFRELERRVHRFETYFYVAVGIAAVFGISGAFGAKMISDAYSEIQKLQLNITTLQATATELQSSYAQVSENLRREVERNNTTLQSTAREAVREAVNSEAGAQRLALISNSVASISARTGAVETSVATLTERVSPLPGRINVLEAGTASLVPRGMLAHFNSTGCPQGWFPVEDARGRYIVGVTSNGRLGQQVGTPLSDGENRPTGAHTHQQGGWPLHYNTPGTFGIQQGAGGASATMPTQTGSVDGAAAGTNAPYVQYLICRKS